MPVSTVGIKLAVSCCDVVDGATDKVNPLDARSLYTDFAQTSLRRQKSVYRRHGISTPPPEAGVPAARYINATGQKPVYRICFLLCTGTGMPES